MDGPGLKVLSTSQWYGGGYCGICGDTGPNLIPQCVRWWCPDDGWKVGVLCGPCCKDARARGPRPGDYAYRGAETTADLCDVGVFAGDEDSAFADSQDRCGDSEGWGIA